jgi:hypothetical protein
VWADAHLRRDRRDLQTEPRLHHLLHGAVKLAGDPPARPVPPHPRPDPPTSALSRAPASHAPLCPGRGTPPVRIDPARP